MTNKTNTSLMEKVEKSDAVVREVSGKQGFPDLLDKYKGEIAKALPEHIKPERMMRLALGAFNKNPKLKQCDPMSIMSAVMDSAVCGLEMNTPLDHAYLIPYGKEATFQLGYKGLVELCHRTNKYKRIDAVAVYEQDHFEYELGLNHKLEHRPSDEQSGEPTHYYAVIELINGFNKFVVMSHKQVLAHGIEYSPSYKKQYNDFEKGSVWKTNFPAAAKKTVLKAALNLCPKTTELSYQLAAEEKNIEKKDDGITIDIGGK